MNQYDYNKHNFSDELYNIDIFGVATNTVLHSMLYNIFFDLVQRKP